jgi:hypothetical protein
MARGKRTFKKQPDRLEARLAQMDQKLDHIPFRLLEEDPRVNHHQDTSLDQSEVQPMKRPRKHT